MAERGDFCDYGPGWKSVVAVNFQKIKEIPNEAHEEREKNCCCDWMI